MKATLPRPAFVVLPGDFLAHSFRQKFDATAPDHSDAAYSGFVIKTFAFLADELRRRFPGATLFPALGNNDSVCGDYRLQPDGAFLAATLPIVHALTHTGPSADFDADWSRLGQYDLPVPGIPHQRIIFVNTVYFSTEYKDACARAGAADPAPAVLHWLAAHLAQARAAGDHVWLLMHIPPGIDVYATLHGDTAPKVETMWREDDAAALCIARAPIRRDHHDELRRPHAHGRVPPDRRRRPGSRHPRDQPDLRPEPGVSRRGTMARTARSSIARRLCSTACKPAAGGTNTISTRHGARSASTPTACARSPAGSAPIRAAATRYLSLYPLSRAAFWKPSLAAQPASVVRAYLCSAAHTDVAAFRSCWSARSNEAQLPLRPRGRRGPG